MAARAQVTVGSAPWINAEKENVMRLLEQEEEELLYPAQHEIEWLNEHMAEIFSKSHLNVADVFKTPGKLRGKTPRTGRKRNASESRMPLSDVFSSKPHAVSSPRPTPKFNKPAAAFAIAKDDYEEKEAQNPSAPPKPCTDSGYHGSTEDEIEDNIPAPLSSGQHSLSPQDERLNGEVQPSAAPASAERRTTEGSFHSAPEMITAKVLAVPETKENDGDISRQELSGPGKTEVESGVAHVNREAGGLGVGENLRPDLAQELDDIGSPSDGSTPDRPLVRKSSLTFASLPAREPLNTKKSFGARESRTSHLDRAKNGSNSYFGKQANSSYVASTHSQRDDHFDGAMSGIAKSKEADITNEATGAVQIHSKSSTQRLHEKIDMLGKSQPSRLSKSIPSAAALAASRLRKSETSIRVETDDSAAQAPVETVVDEDDDWIKPLKKVESDVRPTLTKSHTTDVMENIVGEEADDSDDETEFDMRAPELIAYDERMKTPVRMSPSPGKMLPGFGHSKSASTATLTSPGKAEMGPGPTIKSVSVSHPPHPSTTPKGSPRRIFDAPLSASKSKLQSIMKTAKGLFTSSAGVSAAAKMETLSPKALRIAADNMPALYPDINALLEEKPLPPSPPKHERRTRSSTEREKVEKRKDRELQDKQKAEEQLEKAREKEKQNAVQFKADGNIAHAQTSRPLQPIRKSPRRLAEPHQEAEEPTDSREMPPPAVPSMQSKVQRPARPTRELSRKNRPQPMSIRVGSTLSQRMPISTSSLASSLQETLPPTSTRQHVVSKKTSNGSLHSTAPSAGFKSSATSQAGKPRALLVAERKKEADEREAQRKLEQKRETERKRAAQQEEARRQEQKQRAEAERKERERVAAEHAKKSAQQQALEKRRQEHARKMEQQRSANASNDLSSVSQMGPLASQQHEIGASRPPSRLGATSTLNRSFVGHNLPTNPAKPPKRPHEDEAAPSRSQAPKYGGASQQADTKRRRTEDQESIEPVSRPTMSGAPIRQSNMGRKPAIFSHGYVPAPGGPHMTQAENQLRQFPQPPNSHRVVHASEMSKYANGNKIPFAEAPNPPAYTPLHNKTPSNQHHQPPPKSSLQIVKSSPQPQQYTPGETIALPEIPSDSESDPDDDDSSNGAGTSGAFPVPSWASPTTLTTHLIAQEAVDGDTVFGPIAPLRMEEIFAKGNKDRLKKFRERTSSANWASSGDGLTVEEIRRDRELRERMRLEGGWRYGS